MTINHIGDKVRTHLANFFAVEQVGHPKKSGNLTNSRSDQSKRGHSPGKIPFDKPQASWLQNALGDTFTVFGKHVDG